MEAYNRSMACWESRLLPSLRKVRELGVVTGEEPAAPDQITLAPQSARAASRTEPEPMLRSLLLFLSERRALRRWMETSPAAAVLTRRFVAGQTLDQEVEVCRHLNSEGILVSLDHLGENVASAAEARASLDVYIEALRRIAGENLKASVSVKLTQFGLDLSEDLCRENVAALLEAARAHGSFVGF